ncbi:hypothetical protein SDC9_126295 [bioreactor metagenome]|uniref:Uncharacterized protein n=1 Tax=bioreactor metagenome TaxID=1076179 RepID=A0A645CRB8_9ZZZZ
MLFCPGIFAQNNIEVIPEGTHVIITAPDTKIQTETIQPGGQHEKDNIVAADKQREQEIHVLIKAKKAELENSADESHKATLNDEIQQLQDELQILMNPPVEMKPEDITTPDLK